MRAVRLIARRSRARGSLLLSLFSVATIAVFLLAGIAGYLAGTADAATRDTLSLGPATSVSVQLSTRLAPNVARQTDAVDRLIDDAFRGLEVAVHRSVRSNPAEAIVGDRRASVILAADQTLEQHVELVAGAWPASGETGATMQATAAEELGLEPGDEFTVEGERFVLAATWHPVAVTSPYWFADPAVASGFDGSSVGPVVISEGTLAELPVRSYAEWTVVPTGSALTARALPQLAAALDDLAGRTKRLEGSESIELNGTLAERVDAVQRGLGVAGALSTVPALLVGVIALIAVTQLARLLVAVRRTETALVRARGASVTQLTAISLVEAVSVVVPGSALGLALVSGLLAAGWIPLSLTAMAGAAWPVAVAAAGAAVVVCGVVGWRAASVAATAAGGDSGRARTAVTFGAAALVLGAAGVSVWQFKLYGSPLVTDRDGGLRVDPLTVAAPALMLLALAVLGVLAFGPVARLLERWAAVGRGILPALPGRQVARRAPVFGVALLLITLAVSGATLTAALSQTTTAASEASARLANGADVRVRLSPPARIEGVSSLITSTPYLRLPGVDDAATVLLTPTRIADDTVGLIAMATSRMPSVMAEVDDASDPGHIAAALQSEPTGPQLGNAHQLSLTVRASPGRDAGTVEVFSWLEDADGSLARISHGVAAIAAAVEQPVTLTADLPEGRAGGWRLLAVEATLAAVGGSSGVSVAVEGLGHDFNLTLSSTDPTDRALAYRKPPSVLMVATDALASRLSLETGTAVTLRIPSTGSAVDVVVAGTTPAIPASTGRLGLVADLPSLNRYLLATSELIPQLGEVWISGAADAELVEAAVAVSRSSATVTTAADEPGPRLTHSAIVALWWGAAGSLLPAAIAVLAITSTFTQDRRGEVVVLRALGLSSTEQGRNRLVEVVAVAAAGLVAGVASGLITAAVTASELASTGAGPGLPVALRFDVLGWAVLVFALVAALVTISTGYAGRVARQARDTAYRGETR